MDKELKSIIVEVEEDEDGELVLPLPEYLLKEVGWYPGDVLQWIDNKDGSWTLTKKETDGKD